MKTRLGAGLALAVVVLFAATTARARNDQTVVIGVGVGPAGTSDAVAGSQQVTASHLYAEWYVLGAAGLGVRRIALTDGGLLDLLSDYSVTVTLATGHWVAYGAQEDLRIGLIAGVGRADYHYRPNGWFSNDLETSGTAALAGAYLDKGGSGLGVRIGLDYLWTRLDPLAVPGQGEQAADAGGASLYLDLRWAF